MTALMKEFMLMVPFLPLAVAMVLGVRGAYIGE